MLKERHRRENGLGTANHVPDADLAMDEVSQSVPKAALEASDRRPVSQVDAELRTSAMRDLTPCHDDVGS